MVSSFFFGSLVCLVSLAEVFFASQLDNDTSVLTALNNTKTHLSKHSPCFALAVFAALLQFWCFSCLSQRGLHFKERQTCNFVSTNLQFSLFCQQLSSRSIQSPISATRIFSVPPPSPQPNSIAAHSSHANPAFSPVLWGVLAAAFLTGSIPVILEQIDQQSNAARTFNLRL